MPEVKCFLSALFVVLGVFWMIGLDLEGFFFPKKAVTGS